MIELRQKVFAIHEPLQVFNGLLSLRVCFGLPVATIGTPAFRLLNFAIVASDLKTHPSTLRCECPLEVLWINLCLEVPSALSTGQSQKLISVSRNRHSKPHDLALSVWILIFHAVAPRVRTTPCPGVAGQ